MIRTPKEEAEKRMQYLGLPQEVIDRFVNENRIHIAIPCIYDYEDEADINEIRGDVNEDVRWWMEDFKKNNPDDLVYYILYTDSFAIGYRMLTFLIVESTTDDWHFNDEQLKHSNGIMNCQAYIVNLDKNEYSEFGRVNVIHNSNNPDELVRVFYDSNGNLMF